MHNRRLSIKDEILGKISLVLYSFKVLVLGYLKNLNGGLKMAAKKYYWLKLKENFFEEDTIEWLEEQENGVYYSNFYLKLCLKSLKTNGILIRNVGDIFVPYDVKKLSEMTHTKIDTVIVAMELFKKIGLVQILDNGEIYLTQLELMVGSETSKAQLMRNKRERDKKKLLKDGNNVTSKLLNVTNELPECYTEKEIELEKDIDIEKDIELEEELKKETNKDSDREIKTECRKTKHRNTENKQTFKSCDDKEREENRNYKARANSSAYKPMTSIFDE